MDKVILLLFFLLTITVPTFAKDVYISTIMLNQNEISNIYIDDETIIKINDKIMPLILKQFQLRPTSPNVYE